MDVFLSYARDIRPLAERVCRLLEAEGHQVFFDHDDLSGGDEFDAVIRREIARCDVFVFLVSATAIDAGSYALTELAIAVQRPDSARPTILPVRIDATPFEALPPSLRSVSTLDPQGDVPAEIAHAVERIASRRARRRRVLVGRAGVAVALVAAIGVSVWWWWPRSPLPFGAPTTSGAASSDLLTLNDATVRATPTERFVTLFAIPTTNTWSVTVTLADRRVRELRYRVDGKGAFVSTGTLGFTNPLTGLPLVNPTLGIAGPFWDRRAIELVYVDPEGREHGPYQVGFDPREHFATFAKRSLQTVDWITLMRGHDGAVQASFGTPLFYRHGLQAVHYSVDHERLDREVSLAVGGDRWSEVPPEHMLVSLPREVRFVAVQLTYPDGTESEVRRYDVRP